MLRICPSGQGTGWRCHRDRNEGPVGGLGDAEMLAVTAAVQGAGLGDEIALITDGRFSGATVVK